MHFRARIRPYRKNIHFIDGRNPSDPIRVGSNTTETVGGGSMNLINDQTHIVIDPYNDDPNTWEGMYVLFVSGNNARVAAQISTVYRDDSGSDICYLELDRRLPYVPSAGDYLMIFGKHPFGSVALSHGEIISLDKEIDDVTWSTDVDNGYVFCDVTLNEHANHLGRAFSYMMGRHFVLEDVYGRTCFTGIVTAIDINGYGGRLSATGLRKTFEWYLLEDAAYGDTITSTEILRDVASTNPFLLYSSYGIDPLDTWKTAQISGSISVGPRDYTQSQYTAHQILDEILSLGYYGLTDDKVVIQVWDNMYPVMRVIKRTVGDSDTRYMIPASAFESNFKGFGLQTDVANTEGMTYATYTDENGEANVSAISVNLNILQTFGYRNKVYSVNGENEGEALASAAAASMDRSTFGGPGSLTLHGYVKAKHGLAMVPVHYIRAGDVIKIESNVGYTSLYRNQNINLGFFTVGSTSYQASSGLMTITIAEIPPVRDFFANRLEI